MRGLYKKLTLIIAVFAVLIQLVIAYAPLVSASSFANPTDPCIEATDSPFCKDAQENPRGGDAIDNDSSPILGPSSIFYKITQTVTLLTGAISIIMIMVGGFRYIVSGGDGTAIKAAKDTILYAVVGLLVAVFAQTIITFVLSNL